jgi:hypothetical protein
MRAMDITEAQMAAAEKFIKIVLPQPDQWQDIQWEDLVRLVAHYGAIRARAVANGGRIGPNLAVVDVPGEPRCAG